MSRFFVVAAMFFMAAAPAICPAQSSGSPPSLFGVFGGGSVELGQPVTLTVGISGSTTGLTYQWKHNGTNLPGATADAYTIASAAPANAGTYAVAVRNTFG